MTKAVPCACACHTSTGPHKLACTIDAGSSGVPGLPSCSPCSGPDTQALWDQLWGFVDTLTKDSTDPVKTTDGVVFVRTPSLWELVEEAAAMSNQGDGGASAKFERTIVDWDLMEVRATIIEQLAGMLRTRGIARADMRPTVPGQIRHLARLVVTLEPAYLPEFINVTRSWCQQIKTYLRAEREIPNRYLRNTACEECGITNVVITLNGERVVVPAMKVDFAHDWVRAVYCQHCGHTLWRGELEGYALRIDDVPAEQATA